MCTHFAISRILQEKKVLVHIHKLSKIRLGLYVEIKYANCNEVQASL